MIFLLSLSLFGTSIREPLASSKCIQTALRPLPLFRGWSPCSSGCLSGADTWIPSLSPDVSGGRNFTLPPFPCGSSGGTAIAPGSCPFFPFLYLQAIFFTHISDGAVYTQQRSFMVISIGHIQDRIQLGTNFDIFDFSLGKTYQPSTIYTKIDIKSYFSLTTLIDTYKQIISAMDLICVALTQFHMLLYKQYQHLFINMYEHEHGHEYEHEREHEHEHEHEQEIFNWKIYGYW